MPFGIPPSTMGRQAAEQPMVNLKPIELFKNAYVVFEVTNMHHPHLYSSTC